MTAAAAAQGADSPGTIEPGRGYRSFAPMDEALLLDHRVPHVAKTLWGLLDRQARGRQVAIDSLARLAEKLDCSTSTVQRAMTKLADAGWLDVHRAPGRVSRYVLHYEPTQTTPVTGDLTPNGPPVTGDRAPRSLVTGHTRAVPSLEREVRGEGPPEPRTPNHPPTPTYPGRCPEHSCDASPPRCGACGDARRALADAEAADAERVRAAVVTCPTHRLEYPSFGECAGCRADRLAAGDEVPVGRWGPRAAEAS